MPKILNYPIKVSFRVSDEQYEKLRNLSDETDLDFSEILRNLIDMPTSLIKKYIA